jgi:hypothetical protein
MFLCSLQDIGLSGIKMKEGLIIKKINTEEEFEIIHIFGLGGVILANIKTKKFSTITSQGLIKKYELK